MLLQVSCCLFLLCDATHSMSLLSQGVSPSGCWSICHNPVTVSKHLNISSKFFHHLAAPSL